MTTSANNMGSPIRVVLLACGSFNPVTNMHLRMFELARDTLNKTGRYRVVAGIISPVSDGYGKKDLVQANHRCAMLKLALQSSDWIRLDTWETEQDSWTETVKVLQRQKDIYETLVNSNDLIDMPQKKRKFNPDHSLDECDYNIRNLNENSATTAGPLQVKLLCGADMLESFAVPGLWKEEDIEEIVSKFGLVVITREGSSPEKFIYESDVLARFQNNIHLVTEWMTNDISSTRIRRALRRGESVKYLVQDSVIQYVQANNLFAHGDNKYMNQFIPSPNQEESVNLMGSNHNQSTTANTAHLSPCMTYNKGQSHETMTSPQLNHTDSPNLAQHPRGKLYRSRRRERSYDEEFRLRRDYRRDDSVDSIDSVVSPMKNVHLPRSPKKNMTISRSSSSSSSTYMKNVVPSTVSVGNELCGVMQRMSNLRMHGITPETCV
ncbi:hypothetical protein NP493_443g05016 [Ridgeia piscesae]|uniref:Nicotinamide-nucleotide adenylyltransferase n=1 Tax=Ridgeia piscesae TaxID=27915 RepID=A0AAD9KZA7_RIDPI|nr:hypothetical protein NP493_443g05016 [Ridgeia piscesae]